MKVIFLDIDGVLNSAESYNQGFRDSRNYASISPEYVSRLNSIINNTGAVCVISSTWREQHTLDEIEDFLTEAGFTGKVISSTPYGGWNRACEIEEWIKFRVLKHDDIESFIILDDNSIHEHPEKIPHLMERMIKTSWEDGLQNHHVRVAIELLGRKDG